MADARPVLRSIARSDPGRQRTNNEDAVLAMGSVLAVADGMGGHEGGEVASRMAIAALQALGPDPDPSSLVPALVEANQTIRDASPGRDGMPGMGTTCTAAVVREGVAHVAHIGDSRAYLLRDGELRRLTVDHALLAEMVRAGLMTEEQASHDERRNVILRALGAAERPDIDVLDVPLRVGDRLLLSSDGLHSVVADDELRDALGAPIGLAAIADDLIARANRAGGPDNISVVVAELADTVDAGPVATADAVEAAGSRSGAAPARRLLMGVLLATVVVVAVVLLTRQPGGAPATPGPASVEPAQPTVPAPANPSAPTPATPDAGGATPAPTNVPADAPTVNPVTPASPLP